MVSAAVAVFSNRKLVEKILLSSSPNDITRARRIGRTWHQVVAESEAVQTARTLKPLVETDFESLTPLALQSQNSALREHEFLSYPPRQFTYLIKRLISPGLLLHRPHYSRKHRLRINPINQAKISYESFMTYPVPAAEIWAILPSATNERYAAHTADFFSDPPISVLGIEVQTNTRGSISYGSLNIATGITMGHIFNAQRDFMADQELEEGEKLFFYAWLVTMVTPESLVLEAQEVVINRSSEQECKEDQKASSVSDSTQDRWAFHMRDRIPLGQKPRVK